MHTVTENKNKIKCHFLHLKVVKILFSTFDELNTERFISYVLF